MASGESERDAIQLQMGSSMQLSEIIGMVPPAPDSSSRKRKPLAPFDDPKVIQDRIRQYREDGWMPAPIKGEGNKMQQYGVIMQAEGNFKEGETENIRKVCGLFSRPA